MIVHRAIRRLAFLAAALALVAAASPAGLPQPSRIRVATIEGISGPVYYSLADGRFLRIVSLDARGAAGDPERVAENGL